MTHDEALRLALEALKNGKRVRNAEGGTKYQPDLEDKAITAIKAALEAKDEPANDELLRLRDLLGKANALARIRANEIESLKASLYGLYELEKQRDELEQRLTKTEAQLGEAMWNYGELKREQLANQQKTSGSPINTSAALEAKDEPVAVDGNTSDGYHTFNELYEFRKAYNVALFNEWASNGKCSVHKSWRHNDGELCFGGGWFIVVAVLPQGQISNHYEAKDWGLFSVLETERALFEFDGHTGSDVVERLKSYAPPQRKPLTNEEIGDEFVRFQVGGMFTPFLYAVRAIEAAHGIKGEK